MLKKYSMQKQPVLENFFIHTLISLLTCSLIICSSPFWFPTLCSSMKEFFFVSLPKVGSDFFSAKVLFIVGNLIVVVLVGESKLFTPNSSRPASDVYYDEYISRSRALRNSSIIEEKKDRKVGRCFEEKVKNTCEDGEKIVKKRWVKEKVELEKEGNKLIIFSAEELSKRADDFIARVNRKRRLEATLLLR